MPEKRYQVIIARSVQKTLSKLPDKTASRLEATIIYEIEDNVLKVIVVDAGHRRDIYE